MTCSQFCYKRSEPGATVKPAVCPNRHRAAILGRNDRAGPSNFPRGVIFNIASPFCPRPQGSIRPVRTGGHIPAGPLRSHLILVTANGVFDGAPTYQTIAAHDSGSQRRARSADAARSPFDNDCGTRPSGLADRDRRSLIETTMGGYKTLIGPRPRLRCPAERGCHRRGGAEPNVVGRPPGFRPSQTRHRIAAWD